MSQDAPPTDVDKVLLQVRKALAPLMVSKEHWHLSLNASERTSTGKRAIQVKIEMYQTIVIE